MAITRSPASIRSGISCRIACLTDFLPLPSPVPTSQWAIASRVKCEARIRGIERRGFPTFMAIKAPVAAWLILSIVTSL